MSTLRKVRFWPTLFLASAVAAVAIPTTVLAQSSMNGISGWQNGEYGNRAGAMAADAFGLPGAHERMYSLTHPQVLDNGAPAQFVPVTPPAGYSPDYYYAPSGGGYYMGGGGRAVR